MDCNASTDLVGFNYVNIHKNIWALSVTNVLLLAGAGLAYTYNQPQVVFVAILALLISLLPHYLKGVHNIHVPIIFVYGSILFIFASITLGQFNEFYDKFHWYDAFLHFIAGIVFGIVGFLIIYIFYSTNRLRIPQSFIILFAFSFASTIGVVWEIFEFILDRAIGTNLQVNSLEDTMVDLILNTVGAIAASLIGYLYLKKIPVPFIEDTVNQFTKDAIADNKEMTEEVTNVNSL